MPQLNSMPGGAEIWRLDGKHIYLMWRVPNGANGGRGTPMVWHVPNGEAWNAMTDGLPESETRVQREISSRELKAIGAIRAGKTSQIENTAEHPFATWVANYNREAKVNPMLRDPEVMSIYARSLVEGRPPTQGQLESTRYWQTRTPGQREWIKLSAGDPKAAEQRLQDNRIRARNALIDAGYQNPSMALSGFLADKWTRGDITEEQFNDSILKEIDPYHPDASPFAGKYLGENDRIIRTTNGKMYIRQSTEEGYRDWELTGPGQRARYADEEAQWALPSAVLYYDPKTSKHYLRTRTKKGGQWLGWYATSEKEARILSRYYKPQVLRPEYNIDMRKQQTPSVLTLFGVKPGEDGWLEQGVQRLENAAHEEGVRKAGDAITFFERQSGQLLGLEGEDRVQQLVKQWLGPIGMRTWTDEMIGQWAYKLRTNPGSVDLLVEQLKKQRLAMFPEHENPELAYDDIATLARGMVQNIWGEVPDETDPMFAKLVRMNDAYSIEQFLRKEGMKRNKGNVVTQALDDAEPMFGGRVQGGVR